MLSIFFSRHNSFFFFFLLIFPTERIFLHKGRVLWRGRTGRGARGHGTRSVASGRAVAARAGGAVGTRGRREQAWHVRKRGAAEEGARRMIEQHDWQRRRVGLLLLLLARRRRGIVQRHLLLRWIAQLLLTGQRQDLCLGSDRRRGAGSGEGMDADGVQLELWGLDLGRRSHGDEGHLFQRRLQRAELTDQVLDRGRFCSSHGSAGSLRLCGCGLCGLLRTCGGCRLRWLLLGGRGRLLGGRARLLCGSFSYPVTLALVEGVDRTGQAAGVDPFAQQPTQSKEQPL